MKAFEMDSTNDKAKSKGQSCIDTKRSRSLSDNRKKIGGMNCALVYLTLCKYKKYFLYELY